jgi:hypothetical protein
MQDRERIGLGLVAMTVASVPVLFFFLVVQSPILGVAALLVELGLFTASRIALSRPPKPVGAARLHPPHQR